MVARMNHQGRTVEIRFWWPGAPPRALARWFEAGSPGEVETRPDHYYRTGTLELGVKLRGGPGGACEMKARAAEYPLDGGARCADMWIKHEVDPALFTGETVLVTKHRRLRHFALDGEDVRETGGTGPSACEVELAQVEALGENWTTLCFEARAPFDDPLSLLLPVWKALDPPALLQARVASYPEFVLEMLGGGEEPDGALI